MGEARDCHRICHHPDGFRHHDRQGIDSDGRQTREPLDQEDIQSKLEKHHHESEMETQPKSQRPAKQLRDIPGKQVDESSHCSRRQGPLNDPNPGSDQDDREDSEPAGHEEDPDGSGLDAGRNEGHPIRGANVMRDLQQASEINLVDGEGHHDQRGEQDVRPHRRRPTRPEREERSRDQQTDPGYNGSHEAAVGREVAQGELASAEQVDIRLLQAGVECRDQQAGQHRRVHIGTPSLRTQGAGDQDADSHTQRCHHQPHGECLHRGGEHV